jgi:hypothetical protein
LARTRTTDLEAPTRNAWVALPYHGYGICANPACGAAMHLCGVNTDSRICLACFEFVYRETPPNMRRRKA